jgi:starch phosphorylase
MAYDVAMPGFNTYNCNTIRLWGAKPFCEFDLERFNQGNYYAAIADRQKADEITKVLCY